jgi:gamma-glutamyltranspeptidase/glutathione hydrolase
MRGLRPTVSSRHGIVAAAHPLAASAGAAMLARGGNAFDAIVATAAALNVVEPFMSSFAGMGSATCWVARERRVRSLDFVPPVPRAFRAEAFSKRDEVQRGAHAVGTPGNLAGWAELQRTYGALTLGDALAPAIRIARDGFGLAEFGSEMTALSDMDLRRFPNLHPAWVSAYSDQGTGRAAPGWRLVQTDLAATLDAVAKQGIGHLYGGALGQRIVAHLSREGGCVSLSELEAVPALVAKSWKEPTAARYRDLTVHTPPPPCEGFQMLLSLRVLDSFGLAALEQNGIEHVDTVLRAIRLAAGVRIARNNPNPAALAEILSEAHVETLRARVRDGHPITGPTEQWVGVPGDHHTTSMSAADADGNMVCLTNSLGSPYGAGFVVPGTGLFMNNFLYWADVQPGSPNRTKGGDLLPMCMAPTISTRHGEPVLALGTPGSYGILQTQVQALVQHVDFGLAPQDAIEAPRVRLWDGCLIEPETRLPERVRDGLARRGHEIKASKDWTWAVGGMHAVSRDPATGLLTGGCDPRRDGYVVAAV